MAHQLSGGIRIGRKINIKMTKEYNSSIVELEAKITRPLREGAELPRDLTLLIRLELAEVYMSACEGEPTLSVWNYSMLSCQ